MRRLYSLVAVLLLFTAALPAMACLNATQAQTACCRAMRSPIHASCGEMEKQACCNLTVPAATHPQLAVRSVSPDFQPTLLLPVIFPPPAHPLAATLPRSAQADHPPPGLLLVRSTVLRI